MSKNEARLLLKFRRVTESHVTTPGLRAIVEHFGSEVLNSEGELDRQALAAIVFEDEQ